MRTRAQRWARPGTIAALAGCALLIAVVALDGRASAGAADHAVRADAAPTLVTAVIPDPGPGSTLTAPGPLDASPFASAARDPSAAAGVQHAAMARAPEGATTTMPSSAPTRGGKKGASAGAIGLAVVVVAIAAAAVATPGLLRRRRLAQEAAEASPPSRHAPPPVSAGDAVDDLREQRG